MIRISTVENGHIYQIFISPTFGLNFLKKFYKDDLHVMKTSFTNFIKKKKIICLFLEIDVWLFFFLKSGWSSLECICNAKNTNKRIIEEEANGNGYGRWTTFC